MKKFLALFLVLAMLIPLCVVSASAEGEPVVAWNTPVLKARNGVISVDGEVTGADQALAMDTWIVNNGYTAMGASWDATADMLYLGLVSKQISYGAPTWSGATVTPTSYALTSVTVELEKGTYTWNGTALTSPEGLTGTAAANTDGSLLELAIPLNAIVAYQRENGDIYSSAKITVVTNNVTETFNGVIIYVAHQVVYSSTLAGEQTGATNYFTNTVKELGAYIKDQTTGLFVERFNRSNSKNGANQFQPFFTDSASDSTAALFAENANGSISFDYLLVNPGFTSAPSTTEKTDNVYGQQYLNTTGNGFRSLIYISMGSKSHNSNLHAVSQFVFSIYNTEEGLVLYYDNDGDYTQSVKLSQSCGNWFKLSLDWTPVVENGTVSAYDFTVRANGRIVGTIEGATAGETRSLPLWRSNGVAFGIACDDISSGNYGNSNRDATYRNVAFASTTDASAANYLLSAHGFLKELGFQQNTDAVRFVTKIADLDYTSVGFEVTATYKGETKAVTKTTDTVYTSIMADGATISAEGKYWMAVEINGIPTDAEVTFTIRPFVVMSDGTTKLYGSIGTTTLNAAS